MILGTTATARADTELLTATIEAAVRRLDPADGRPERVDRDGPFDRDLWGLLAGEVGVCALAVPEDRGGLGASFQDVAAVLTLLGAELSRVPCLSAVLATGALADCPATPATDEYLAGITAGTLIVTTVVPVPSGDTQFQVERVGGDLVLSGTESFVVDGDIADVVLVPAAGADCSVGLYAVSADTLTRTRMTVTDGTRVMSTITADRVPAVLLDPHPSIRRLQDRALVALACDGLGVATRTLDDAVAYANGRVQFGRVIGGFQAVKHRLAEVAVAVELAKSAVAHAVWAVDEGTDHDLSEAAAIAAIACGEAACRATAENVQVHGGIGFTWEHTAHLFYRRALSNDVLWGSGDQHAQRLYQLAVDGPTRVSPDAVSSPTAAPTSLPHSNTAAW
ncbi:acyl-CoA dehydrogenase family protein [Rhodococcus wratislaviensis]|uniref:Putative acyl-CoA dehydrogenase n=1 Tax=Rhodococcus wratislaviensis NBRC 100605 TaxID=1219028 RepID=X0PPN3_RHOWR|nr:acyl-CoA dehydrogenase family protein [Rhodococcus wratislaviensis]GAF44714.1 putative acyl-CoA dehydrogenase [Rhodococcus wratislaviensis NBRC 100605]